MPSNLASLFSRRLLRTFEFLLSIAVGLAISSIFATIILGGRYTQVVDHPNWPQAAATAAHNTDIATLTKVLGEAKTIGLWRTFSPMERALLAVIAANLVRLLHSFFLLYREPEYETLVSHHAKIITACQFLSQVALLGLSLLLAGWLSPGDRYICYYACLVIGALTVWDGSITLANCWTVGIWKLAWEDMQTPASGDRRLKIVFSRWFLLELATIICFMAAVTAHAVLGTSQAVADLEANRWWIELFSVVLFSAFLVADYCCNYVLYFVGIIPISNRNGIPADTA